MAKIIFNVLFEILLAIANIILFPINSALSTFVPNLSTAITNITNGINVFITNALMYFFSILPPNCRYLIVFYLGFLVIFYTISYTLHGVMWVIKIIKKLPLA